MRKECDSLGMLELTDDAVYGIHTLRALDNFPITGERINLQLIKAYLFVKNAAAETNFKIGLLPKEKYEPIIKAIDLLIGETESAIKKESFGIHEKIIVDPYQGGAGTSLNMNINEVIANLALSYAGKKFGEYNFIHPIDDVNLSQSTNDTYPTALKVASIFLLRELAESFAVLQSSLQKKENEFSNVIKLGRTQLQDAVAITLGQEFGAYAQAIARDRWRLYNAEERLRSVNLGGTAVGNFVSAPKEYVLSVNAELKKITGLPIAKAEDLIDATQNFDVFIEVHGLIKAGACSLIKICNDLRLMSSGPHGGFGEIILPAMQAGSSIMPGKVNPVILENVIQVSELIKGHDVVISNLAASGNFELNAFTPLLAHLFLKSIEMLRDAIHNLSDKCISELRANEERCKQNLLKSSAAAASLINIFGYDSIAKIVNEAESKNLTFIELLKQKKLLTEKELYGLLTREMGIKNEERTKN
ncbi:MAG: aspartate ammonia-lyase [Bacteroidetes bacterium]|nr:aspartate ammonia-lyase [Bacteroidota bacterium]